MLRSHGTNLTVRKFRHQAVQGQKFSRYGRKFDRRSDSHDDRLNVFYDQGMVALMSGNSAARRHFGFVQVAHCAWADDKATEKSQN